MHQDDGYRQHVLVWCHANMKYTALRIWSFGIHWEELHFRELSTFSSTYSSSFVKNNGSCNKIHFNHKSVPSVSLLAHRFLGFEFTWLMIFFPILYDLCRFWNFPPRPLLIITCVIVISSSLVFLWLAFAHFNFSFIQWFFKHKNLIMYYLITCSKYFWWPL